MVGTEESSVPRAWGSSQLHSGKECVGGPGSPRCWGRGKETVSGRFQFEASGSLHLAFRALDTSAST